ncbi:MFS transporter [Micromonospora sp. WMMD708]|uniref:MFS transporter n=1 Tax=Micromonospora sp. WMMD708 TaxID=3403464 RepID=UPI003BF4D1DC
MTVDTRQPSRTTTPVLLYAAQAVAAVGMAAGGSAGGILATDLTGSTAAATLPLGAIALGATVAVLPVGAAMRWRSRKAGLLLGLLTAVVGAVTVVGGARLADLPLVLAGNALLGAGNTAVMFGRYAAADLVPAGARTRAVAAALTAASVGAVLGPNLLGPAGGLASAAGLPASAGLYLLAVPAFGIAALLVARLPTPTTPPAEAGPRTAPAARIGLPPVPVLVLGGANATMVTMMAVAPPAMHHHGWDLGTVGAVVSLHVAAMFGFSPVTARLCEAFRAVPVAVAGAVLSAGSALGAGLTAARPQLGVPAAGFLLVLGLAWNMQLVSGTVLLLARTPQGARRWAEDLGEIIMGTAAVLGTFLAAPLLDVAGLTGVAVAAFALNAGTALAVSRSRDNRP